VMAGMGLLPGAEVHRILASLGFTWAHDEVDVIIVGTLNPDHIKTNVEWVKTRLPIDEAIVQELHRRFDEVGRDWVQLG